MANQFFSWWSREPCIPRITRRASSRIPNWENYVTGCTTSYIIAMFPNFHIIPVFVETTRPTSTSIPSSLRMASVSRKLLHLRLQQQHLYSRIPSASLLRAARCLAVQPMSLLSTDERNSRSFFLSMVLHLRLWCILVYMPLEWITSVPRGKY